MNTVATTTRCPVCGADAVAPILDRGVAPSISSKALVLAAPTTVYACRRCAHVHTPPLADIGSYYDVGYNVRLEGDDADDLYELRDGTPFYRAQHQAAVALNKLQLRQNAAVLDFGCGKGATLRAMLSARPDLHPFVFDVSTNYRAHWNAFVPPDNQASYSVPAGWNETFDAVMSFFALEHVGDPQAFLATVRTLLKPGGIAHVVVPNVRANVGDFIVVDHVNHFMPSSIRYAFEAAGFDDVLIDERAHIAAYVVNARRSDRRVAAALDAGVAGYLEEAHRIASMWRAAAAKVAAFEKRQHGRRAAIYGSGFYGVFIASSLADRSDIAYFLDQNPHQQTLRIFDRPVLAPGRLEDDVDVLYVGLNPARARGIIATVPAVQRRTRTTFFLE